MLEHVEPEIREFNSAPDIKASHTLWSESRNTFNADLKSPDPTARNQKWQKDYNRGYTPEGEAGPEDHRTKLRLKPFEHVVTNDSDEG